MKYILRARLLVVALVVFVCYYIFVANPVKLLSADSSPYNFLRNITTARATGLSNTIVSLTDDPGTVFVNPASISTVQNKNINFTFLKHVLDINSGNASYIHHFDEPANGSIAASVIFTNYGSFDYYNTDGDRTGGTFTGNLLALQTSYSNKIDENFYYGVTAKLLYNSLEKMIGVAGAVDFGLLYLLQDGRTNFGFSVLNAGGELKKIGNESNSLPLDIRLGGSHRLRGLPLLFNFNFNHLNEFEKTFFSRFGNFSIGGEFYFGDIVQVRLGYDNYIRKHIASRENKGLSGFSAGLGVVPHNWFMSFDYGLSIYSGDVFLHRLSLNINM